MRLSESRSNLFVSAEREHLRSFAIAMMRLSESRSNLFVFAEREHLRGFQAAKLAKIV